MTALLAMTAGILAVGYAVWPLLRDRQPSPLSEEPDCEQAEAEAEVAALLAWSRATGEMPREAEGAGPLDRNAP